MSDNQSLLVASSSRETGALCLGGAQVRKALINQSEQAKNSTNDLRKKVPGFQKNANGHSQC
ncbi:hypothetical protein ALQ64_00127 [Pseudomonas cannabina]|uniref:Uncharacterized protein n=1 Tax=Pseudomonas cannabina TaxID=86840 RepID=A0A3M3K6B3_PSECA|nr:hypothetical protein ALQ64_00127 [Pseudomonas cannabina]